MPMRAERNTKLPRPRLQAAREKRGLTREFLAIELNALAEARHRTANALGHPPTTTADSVQNWELGRSKPRPVWIELLCKFFDASPEDLDLREVDPVRAKAHGDEDAQDTAQEWHGILRKAPPKRSASAQASGIGLRINRWVLYFRGGLMILLLVIAACIQLLQMLLPAEIAVLPLADAHVAGWLFVRAETPGGPNTLETLDPRTGTLRFLWPTAQEFQQPTMSAQFSDYYGPDYSAATRTLAFVAMQPGGALSAWAGTIIFGSDGWPSLAGTPIHLFDLCRGCGGQMAWSPSGRWLLFQGPDGLYAYSMQTHIQHRITYYPKDAWPACSPDGQWLAYQGPHHGVLAVPSTDCLPNTDDFVNARYVNGFSYAWHPHWALDGTQLIFSSDADKPWILFKVNFSDLATSYDPNQQTPFKRAGASDCGTLTWAQRQQSQQSIIIFSCKAAHPTPLSYGCSLLIQPATASPAWQTIVSAGARLWDDVDWVPPPV
jgi:transcriptional regulator with XRE-family HTH domain